MAAGLSAMVFDPDSPQEVRRITQEILSDPEFAPSQSFLQWLMDRLSGFSAPDLPTDSMIFRFVAWGVVIWCGLTLVAIVAHLIWAFRQALPSGSPARAVGDTGADEVIEATRSFGELTERLQRLESAGAWSEAVPVLMSALLARLEERMLLRRHPAKTNGDYLREYRDAARGLIPFQTFVSDFEALTYGSRRCGAEQYRQLTARYREVLAHAESSA